MKTYLMLAVLTLSACASEPPTAEDVASESPDVGVDKEAITQITLSSWSGITTEPQARQGLHCLTVAMFGKSPVTQPNPTTCSTIVGTNNNGARCLISDGGLYNGMETRVTMSASGSPRTGNVLLNGSSANLTLSYNVTSGWPKTYFVNLAGVQYRCDVQCVGSQCAGVVPVWTVP